MRLLFVSNNYPPHQMGGYELLCEDVATRLVRRGHQVTVLTSTFGSGPGLELSRGAGDEEVVRALDFHWKDFEVRRPTGLALWRGERRQRLLVEELLARVRPDVAVPWGMALLSKSLLETLRRHAVPMAAVVEEHWPLWDVADDAWLARWRGEGPLRRWADRAIAPTRVDAAMATIAPVYASQQLRDQVEAGLPAWGGRGEVLHNGIDLQLFAAGEAAPTAAASPLRLLYAGRVEPRKGVETAVRALRLLRDGGVDATLDVVGWRDEAYVAELRAIAAADGTAGAIRWLDAVPRSELPARYRAAGVLVFPSTWAEPFGLTALEAMACGCPVVGTGTGGAAEFMRDGENCLVFTPGEPAALAAAVTRLRSEPDLAARLRDGGLETAARHDIEGYVDRLEAILAEVSGAPRTAP